MTQHEAFARLIRAGRSIAQIAATFGLTETMVKQRLALGNLLPRLRDLYRRQEVDAETIRHLTMAPKGKQREWLALFDDPKQWTPTGLQAKRWLFGGQAIPVSAALFPLDDYPGRIVSDLFREERYFADPEVFWPLQNAAIAARRDAFLGQGWAAVEVLETGRHFAEWEHERVPKAKGGKVFVTVSHQGEVELHEGWLTRKEARRLRPKTDAEKREPAARPEVSRALRRYLDLHRHAAVRAALPGHPGIALRLLLAHVIAPSGHWQVEREGQQAPNEAVAASLASSTSEATFATERHAVLERLDRSEDEALTVGRYAGEDATAAVFEALMALSDEEVMRLLAIAMGDTLMAGSTAVDAAGTKLGVRMAEAWQADQAFFDLVRDREAVDAMLAEVAGRAVADANLSATLKVRKSIVRDCLEGANGREKVDGWTPAWMAFSARSYTDRGALA
ncbi:chromosome partitioning protein ParB [Mycobacterium sp. KBS0706]|uniref:chromosome partitioning protein ParB n=1 Tax=Mycobacterium sp. KBS0706 TaxID=2578109 RepID=UPI00110FAA10|nr:chromosome partitioning protein ParB [Mycobacterium sp. KBS0706]TSD85253.1 chromosome partitioning protein ParB [Mycobacterium sp. KBS0706]